VTPAPATDTRRCIKCDNEVGREESMCAVCLRAGMVAPAASQYHGTIAVAIVAAVAALAVAASLSLSGVGPYRAAVVDSQPRVDGVALTLSVSNEGTRPGRAKCRIVARDAAGRTIGTLNLLSGQIPGGESLVFDQPLPGLAAVPDELAVTCQ
jgi:hypothetical protein